MERARLVRSLTEGADDVVTLKEGAKAKIVGCVRCGITITIMSVTRIDTVSQSFDCEFVVRAITLNASTLKTEDGRTLTIENFEPRLRFKNIGKFMIVPLLDT